MPSAARPERFTQDSHSNAHAVCPRASLPSSPSSYDCPAPGPETPGGWRVPALSPRPPRRGRRLPCTPWALRGVHKTGTGSSRSRVSFRARPSGLRLPPQPLGASSSGTCLLPPVFLLYTQHPQLQHHPCFQPSRTPEFPQTPTVPPGPRPWGSSSQTSLPSPVSVGSHFSFK